MNFKPALCPSCGGKLQIPDDVRTVKCMYCGVEVVVKEAIQLAGRVKEFTTVTAIEEVINRKPYEVETFGKHTLILVVMFGIFSAISFFCVGSADNSFGIFMGVICLTVLAVILVIRYLNLQKALKAYEKRKAKGDTVIITGYRGECPYCSSSITLSVNKKGDDCPVCLKRIVIRDSKFYSVETPVSGLAGK